MYFITDDCEFDDGIRFETLAEARDNRETLLRALGWHMSDHIHVADADTKEIISEAGAWVVVDENNQGHIFPVSEFEVLWDRWGRGEWEDKPTWVPEYEWNERYA